MTEETQTQLATQKEITKEKIRQAFPDGIVGLFLDFMDLEGTIKAEYAKANAQDRQKFIRWFVMGLIFMFGSMVVALTALGIQDLPGYGWPWFLIFMGKFIAGTVLSLLSGYVVSKVKYQIAVSVKNDRDYLEKLLKTIVSKLSQ
jgi:uncharacterized sodium:solute symporter family permease YidK